MSSSTDSLKKKVCVTVFLDELFEEVVEEDGRELTRVSNVAGSEAKIAEKPYEKPSEKLLEKDEKVDVSPSPNTGQSQALLRPRKHRRESKFAKNRYDSFKKELSKYGYASCIKSGNECCEPESPVSDSEIDLEDFLELDKWAAQNSRSSCSELSEPTEDSFLSIGPLLSSMIFRCSNEDESSAEKRNACLDSSALSCNGSAQFDVAEKTDQTVGYDVRIEKDAKKASEGFLAWKKTQRQIQFILAKAKTRQPERQICEGDRMRRYDLTSILEDCVKKTGGAGSDDALVRLQNARANASADSREPSDSYSRLFPHGKRKRRTRAPEVQRLWSSGRRSAWNDGVESDLSDADCPHFAKEIDLRAIREDSLLCYALCLRCKESIHQRKSREENASLGTLHSAVDSESISRESSLDSMKSKPSRETDLLLRTVTQLANKTVLGKILKTEKEEEQTRNEGSIPVEICRRMPAAEGRSKNFADGDTIEKPSCQDSNFILDFETREKLLLCDEMFLKNVEEAKVVRNKIIVNRAEIELDSREEQEKSARAAAPSSYAPKGRTEVLFKQDETGYAEKNATDAESELVFAESENSWDNEIIFEDELLENLSGSAHCAGESRGKEVCVLELEDELPRSKILRRVKTVEIVGDDSSKDMKNISTEVILICENISDNEVCLEEWQSSNSTLKSATEVGQAFLKDSKDSAMYLIEIPLHFTSAGRAAHRSDHFFKAPDFD